MAYKKITEEDLLNKGVVGMADTPELSTADMQAKFEELTKEVVIPAFNNLVEELTNSFGNIYTKSEIAQLINQKIEDMKNGDMAKWKYDENEDGVVNEADVAHNGIFVYTHNDDNLMGSGANGRFKCTASGNYTTLNINGVSHKVRCGEDSEIELAEGAWYSFCIDGNTVNFNKGGAGLNFKVVGSLTQPASPRENTVWVQTGTAVKQYIVSQDEPTTRADGTALETGDIWIEHGGKSGVEVNVAKKNGIYIRMLTVAMWESGLWVRKEAQLYKNGVWSPFIWKLYDNGSEVMITTGGWSLVSAFSSEYELSKTDDYIYLNTSKSTNSKQSFFCTEKPIDLTSFNNIIAVHTYSKGSYGLFKPVAVHTDRDVPKDNNDFVAYKDLGIDTTKSGTKEVFTLDISALTGVHYVGFAMGTSGGKAHTYFYEMSIT